MHIYLKQHLEVILLVQIPTPPRHHTPLIFFKVILFYISNCVI